MRYRHFRSLLAASLMIGSIGCTATEFPTTVHGIALAGTKTQSISVAVRDAQGQPLSEAEPAVAVVRNSRWSPSDPVRDGAREFEVYLATASLLREHHLAGVIGVGNKLGRMMPDAEQALKRSVLMGVPVVKIATEGYAEVDANNLLIEAGSLSETEARRLLAQCLLRYGTLPPCADPANPTTAEVAAIKEQLIRFQMEFSAADTQMQVASR